MPNIDIGFNKTKLIDLYINRNGLTGLINRNQFDDNFYFNDPVRQDGVLPTHNTYVSVVAKASSAYFGIKRLKYNRIHVTELPTIEVEKETESSVYELLDKINSKYGLYLNEYDIEDEDVSAEPSGLIEINLTIKPTSLIFYSGPIITTTP
jgi:hypothetical protein